MVFLWYLRKISCFSFPIQYSNTIIDFESNKNIPLFTNINILTSL